ncbi:FAD-dependent oxidoreductase [Altererythrobacter sp. Root672]|nr:FAD-dependent oxidoreductase [Altererythrobacter sp. Root672]
MGNAADIPVWREIGETPHPATDRDHATVAIVGGGPVGLSMALELGRRGHRVVVLNRLDFISAGSKAICFAKRTLDIFDRLGVGDGIVDKGVIWNVGKVFRGDRDEPVYQFDMLPVKQQKRPGFINIQQYHVEEQLYDASAGMDTIDLRFGHEVISLETGESGVSLTVRTSGDEYRIDADWVIACDGSRSPVRSMLGLDFDGRIFEDNFLIADVKMEGERPPERWFWFDPPFNPGQSALMHKQPDNVWRLDFQLGWDIDREAAVTPENVERYVRAMLGPEVEFEREWYSLYTFQCRRMEHFLHGRVIFAGDSAHLVSPFGARGCNGGIADIDNLGWKLDLVLRGEAPEWLLETYDYEAVVTADENIRHSTRSTDFMTPKSAASRALRDAVLELARDHPFARPFVNSGRLSTAVSYPSSPLNTPDVDTWERGVPPGSPALDAPLDGGWLLDRLGDRFVLLANCWTDPVPTGVELLDVADYFSARPLLADRYGLTEGAAYLVRPDQYVAARWLSPTPDRVSQALRRATGLQP